MKYKEKAADFLSWFILPFTIWIPIAFSQGYFKDLNYNIIFLQKPSDVFKHNAQKFFKIRSFEVAPNNYFIIRERHTVGKNGTTLNVSNYYIVPMYDDTISRNKELLTSIAYGVIFTTSMHNSLFDKKEQEQKISEFNKKCKQEYEQYEFHNVGYLEKIENTDDATYFSEAAKHNRYFVKDAKPVIFVNKSGTINNLYNRGKNMFMHSTIIYLGIGLTSLLLVNSFSDKQPSR